EADAREALPKAVAAERRLREVNSEIVVEGRVADLNAGNWQTLLQGAELVLDGSDNLETRYVLNDACVREGRPWIYTGAVAAQGMVLPVRPGSSACFRCVFPAPPATAPATCDIAGVLGPVIAAVASLAAMEAIKLLAGAEEALAPGLIHVDLWENEQG